MTETYSTHEVAAATGASYRELYFWIERGYVTLEQRRPLTATSGSPLRWTLADAVRAGAMQALVKAGVYPRTARKVIDGGDYFDGSVTITVDMETVAKRVEAALRQ